MREARWLLGVACMAACAGGPPARVRDIDGKPVPPYAVSNATGPVHTVQCSDGNTYVVVTNRPPFFLGPRMGDVLRFREKSVEDVCDRILANGP
jgi:hypothetical protein